ncbi:GNAT family N-acetyltransferase [Aliagarivorans marinus]|uniref:GNAT family N-acetyltransferase n=1 Tax=Aliagarivorans marinus TaxID=561965 RepID=UPI00042358EC|nr:GNAT family N-acetyltransferase [Aliagarivorans marinus]
MSRQPTPSVTIEELSREQLALVKPLYKQFYKSATPRRDDRLFIARNDHRAIIAAAKLRVIDGKYWLLSGVVVAPAFRQQGIASLLLSHVLQRVEERPCYCFCHPQLATLYIELGFETLDELPDSVLARFNTYRRSKRDLVALKFRC